jgi:hypothetical protein
MIFSLDDIFFGTKHAAKRWLAPIAPPHLLQVVGLSRDDVPTVT